MIPMFAYVLPHRHKSVIAINTHLSENLKISFKFEMFESTIIINLCSNLDILPHSLCSRFLQCVMFVRACCAIEKF